jgi:hypothetical protein
MKCGMWPGCENQDVRSLLPARAVNKDTPVVEGLYKLKTSREDAERSINREVWEPSSFTSLCQVFNIIIKQHGRKRIAISSASPSFPTVHSLVVLTVFGK